MTKTSFALAALIAGTALTSAAHADAVRVGFGFPLGSFVAHSNANSGGRDFRRVERARVVRRDYEAGAPARKVVKVKQAPKADVAETTVKAPITPPVQTAKLEDKLASDPATTTVIEKTPDAKSAAAPAAAAAETTVNADNNANDDKPAATKTESETATASTDTTHICRRYAPAIDALIDVPCE